MSGRSERWLGVFMLLGSGICFIISGVLIRLIESATVWQVVFYRSASRALAILLAMSLQSRTIPWRTLLSIGRFGAIGSVGLAVGSVFVVWAQFHTSIANVLFILGALPFLSALLARLFLGERVRGLTWLAMAAALVGIGVMVWGGVESGRLMGNVLAIIGISGFALMTVALRHGRQGTAALVAAGGMLASGPAVAQVKISVGGTYDAIFTVINQDRDSGERNNVVDSDGEIYFRGSTYARQRLDRRRQRGARSPDGWPRSDRREFSDD